MRKELKLKYKRIRSLKQWSLYKFLKTNRKKRPFKSSTMTT